MSDLNWVGNAQPRADQWWVRPITVPDSNSKFTLSINDKTITVKAGDPDASGTATPVTAVGVCTLFKEAIQRASFPEWREVSVLSANLNADNSYSKVSSGGSMLVLTGPSDGKPVTITGSTSTSVKPAVHVLESIKGVTGRNEKQSIGFSMTATGGTFTLTYSGQTTAAIAYNANAGTVQAALEALSNLGAGQVTVTGTAGAWVVEFTGTLAQTNVPLMSGDGSSLTGTGVIAVTTVTDGLSEAVAIVDYVLSLDWSDAYPDSTYPEYALIPTMPHTFAISDPTGVAGDTHPPGFSFFNYNHDEVNATGWLFGDAYGIAYFTPNGMVGYTATDYELTMGVGAGATSTILLRNVTSLYPEYSGTLNIVIRATIPLGNSEWNPWNIRIAHLVGFAEGYSANGKWSAWSTSTSPITVLETGEVRDEVQSISVSKATGGTFTLTFDGQTTAGISYSATGATLASNIQTALIALSNLDSGDVTVAFSGETSTAMVCTATFGGAYAATNVSEMTGDGSSLTGVIVAIFTTQTRIVDVAEVQLVSLLYNPSGGTFTLSFGGYTTSTIAYDASAATVESELEGLTSIGAGNVTVSGDAGGPWTVTFAGTLAGADHALITGNGYALTVAGTQSMELSRAYSMKYTAGDWNATTLVFTVGGASDHPVNDGVSVGDYAYVCPDGEIGEAAYLSRVTARDATTITLSEDECEGTAPTTDTGNRTLMIVTAPTGPNYWDNVDNWSTKVLPADGDTIYVQYTTVPILYHINQSLITPAEVHFNASFEATCGLPEQSEKGYREYRRKSLRIGNDADAQAITITIGRGTGSSVSLINLDTGDAETHLSIFSTTTSSQATLPTVLWKGTHADNTVHVQSGSFGAAVLAGETATIATLNVDWYSSQETDSEVTIGSGVTLTTILKSGGSLVTYAGFTTLTQMAGDTVIHDGAAGTVTLHGGNYIHNSDGNITALTIYDAVADFSRSTEAITVTNTTVYKDFSLLDPNERITFTNPIVQHGYPKELDLGMDISLQRS